MKKFALSNKIKFIAKHSEKDYDKIDYYLILDNHEWKYAFSRKFSISCYNIYKSGVPINTALYTKDMNRAHMNLIKYLNFIMPYLIECLGLKAISKSKKKYFQRNQRKLAYA